MDITKELLKEHSRSQAEKIADYIGKNPKRFEELLAAFLKGDYRLTQRSAWALSICGDRQPEMIRPYLKDLIHNLSKKDLHPAVVRNTLRVLQFQKIPKSFQGKTIDLCFEFLLTKNQPVAIKVFAMTVLANLSQEHPELKNELKIAIEDQLPYETAAFSSRGRKILNSLNHDF